MQLFKLLAVVYPYSLITINSLLMYMCERMNDSNCEFENLYFYFISRANK